VVFQAAALPELGETVIIAYTPLGSCG